MSRTEGDYGDLFETNILAYPKKTNSNPSILTRSSNVNKVFTYLTRSGYDTLDLECYYLKNYYNVIRILFSIGVLNIRTLGKVSRFVVSLIAYSLYDF